MSLRSSLAQQYILCRFPITFARVARAAERPVSTSICCTSECYVGVAAYGSLLSCAVREYFRCLPRCPSVQGAYQTFRPTFVSVRAFVSSAWTLSAAEIHIQSSFKTEYSCGPAKPLGLCFFVDSLKVSNGTTGRPLMSITLRNISAFC